MSQATNQTNQNLTNGPGSTNPSDQPKKGVIEYQPVGGSRQVKLTAQAILTNLCRPTKQGHYPSKRDVMNFMALCAHLRLNPFAGDAYLLGYDGQDGPTFSIVCSIGSLLKRAEVHPAYQGIESGLICQTSQGIVQDIEGECCPPGMIVYGGWAKVYRSDRRTVFQGRLTLVDYDQHRGHWKKSPSRMITKCAEAHALRKAFPAELAGQYEYAERQDLGVDMHELPETVPGENMPEMEYLAEEAVEQALGGPGSLAELLDKQMEQLSRKRSVRTLQETAGIMLDDLESDPDLDAESVAHHRQQLLSYVEDRTKEIEAAGQEGE